MNLKSLVKSAHQNYKKEGIISTLKKVNYYVLNQVIWKIEPLYINLLSSFSDRKANELRYQNLSESKIQSYTNPVDYSELIYDLINTHTSGEGASGNICEIGCNAGRHLKYLYDNGENNLFGIEINPTAITVLEKEFPNLAAQTNISIGPAQDELKEFDDDKFEVVYSCAVLMHITGDQNELFDEMARVSNDVMIIIELDQLQRIPQEIIPSNKRNEYIYGKGIQNLEPRNYQDIFENRGFSQVKKIDAWDESKEGKKLSEFSAGSTTGVATARVFKKMNG